MKKIFIIEDDVLLMRMYSDELTRSGYEVSGALDYKSAIPTLERADFDLVVLDIMLPGGVNGFDILEALKKNDKTKNKPVIILTNLDTEEIVAKDIGASEYIVKVNVTPRQFVERVKLVLDRN